MKICVITATYPMRGFGGVFIKEQCEQLVANGHEVCVLYCSGMQRTVHDFKVHMLKDNGVQVIFNCFPRYATTHIPRLWCKVMMHQLRKMYKKLVNDIWKPDVLYAHFSFPAGRIATQLGLEENIPVVVAEHWSGFITGKAKGKVLSIIQESMDHADSLICVSPALKDAIDKCVHSPQKVYIIPNMLSKEFSYQPRIEKDHFLFFSLGTLNEKKQFELLIKAFIEAFSPDDKVKLRIGGSGPDESKLKQVIISNNRERQIEMIGMLDRNETIREYSQCDSFILLSPNETFGIVYREAMAVGRPVISVDNGGIRYQWDDANGIIIPNNTDSVFVDTINAMKTMVVDIDSYDSKAISDSTLDSFSAPQVAKKLVGVLIEAVNQKGV